VGRPKAHDARTAAALLDAAERLVQARGIDALSLRRVATAAGTTTRAVYSVYGNKAGLLAALGVRAFELLGTAVTALPSTDDPAADLVTAGVTVFRRFAVDHPSLFRIGMQHRLPAAPLTGDVREAAAQALTGLLARIARLEQAGLLGARTVAQAAWAFHALCEGLAAAELRRGLPPGQEEQLWRDALAALVAGFAAAPPRDPPGAPAAPGGRVPRSV
jgi:AcrR family transcriptional regulator